MNCPARVKLTRLHDWALKLDETRKDIEEGRLSMTVGPIEVSRLDNPRGHFWIVNGHHRALEAAYAGANDIEIVLSREIPRIERTGGAYRSILNDRRRLIS